MSGGPYRGVNETRRVAHDNMGNTFVRTYCRIPYDMDDGQFRFGGPFDAKRKLMFQGGSGSVSSNAGSAAGNSYHAPSVHSVHSGSGSRRSGGSNASVNYTQNRSGSQVVVNGSAGSGSTRTMESPIHVPRSGSGTFDPDFGYYSQGSTRSHSTPSFLRGSGGSWHSGGNRGSGSWRSSGSSSSSSGLRSFRSHVFSNSSIWSQESRMPEIVMRPVRDVSGRDWDSYRNRKRTRSGRYY